MQKIMFSQKPELIRSIASDGLTKYLEATVSLNMIKKTVQICWIEKQVLKTKLKSKVNEA